MNGCVRIYYYIFNSYVETNLFMTYKPTLNMYFLHQMHVSIKKQSVVNHSSEFHQIFEEKSCCNIMFYINQWFSNWGLGRGALEASRESPENLRERQSKQCKNPLNIINNYCFI